MVTRRELAGRLDAAIGERNASELAKRLRVTRQAISNWRTGLRLPDAVKLEALCAQLGLSADDLLGLPARIAPAPPAAPDGVVGMSLRVGRVAAGEPRFEAIEDGSGRTYYFAEKWLRKRLGWSENDRERWLPVTVDGTIGDSMLPTIRPFALLLVDRGSGPEPRGVRTLREVRNGSIYLCWIDEGLTVKRVFKADRTVLLWPDNPAHEKRPLTTEELKELPRHLLGRVVWVGQELE